MSMRRQRLKHDDTETALANFALTFAKALLVFCVVLFLMIAPPKKEEAGVKPKMEYLISISWPINVDADVDVWLRDPDGNIIWYGNKEAGLINLERDDMGRRNNKMMVGDREIIKLTNEELISFRGFKPGEYIINVHLYSYGIAFNYGEPLAAPLPIQVTITKMNPSVTVVWAGNATLEYLRQETHVVRFILDEDGRTSGFETEMPVMLREQIKGKNVDPMNPLFPSVPQEQSQ